MYHRFHTSSVYADKLEGICVRMCVHVVRTRFKYFSILFTISFRTISNPNRCAHAFDIFHVIYVYIMYVFFNIHTQSHMSWLVYITHICLYLWLYTYLYRNQYTYALCALLYDMLSLKLIFFKGITTMSIRIVLYVQIYIFILV